MLRMALRRSVKLARGTVHSRIAVGAPRLAFQYPARWESGKADRPAPSGAETLGSQGEVKVKKPASPWKEALELRDNLQRDWDAQETSYHEVKTKTRQPTFDRYLVDVREPDEVLQGAIPSSVNLPLSVLSNALHLNPEAFKEAYGFAKPRKDQELIFYCRSGKRSTTACDVAKRNGFTNILNYKGSWLEWVEKENIKIPPS